MVLLNRFSEGAGVEAKDVENGLGHAVTAVLINDEQTVTQSINLGEPLVLGGKSRLAREILKIGAEVAGPDHAETARSGLLKTLLRPFRGAKPAAKDANEETS